MNPMIRLIEPQQPTDGNAGRRGMILILTLWVLAALSLLFLTLASSVNLNTKEAVAFKSDAESAAAARGAISAVSRKLIDLHALLDQKKKSATGLKVDRESDPQYKLESGTELGFYLVEPEQWKVTQYKEGQLLPSGENWRDRNYVVCLVTAEDAKAPLLSLKDSAWFKVPGMSREAASRLNRYLRESGRITCVEHLLGLGLIGGKLYDGGEDTPGLKNLLTTFSAGKIYVSRASPPVIAMTLDLPLNKAKMIAGNIREKNHRITLSELEKVSGIDAGSLKGSVNTICASYRIKAYAVFSGRIHILEAVLFFASPTKPQIAYMGSV